MINLVGQLFREVTWIGCSVVQTSEWREEKSKSDKPKLKYFFDNIALWNKEDQLINMNLIQNIQQMLLVVCTPLSQNIVFRHSWREYHRSSPNNSQQQSTVVWRGTNHKAMTVYWVPKINWCIGQQRLSHLFQAKRRSTGAQVKQNFNDGYRRNASHHTVSLRAIRVSVMTPVHHWKLL